MYVLTNLLFLKNFSKVLHLPEKKKKKRDTFLNCEVIPTSCQVFGHEHTLGVRH